MTTIRRATEADAPALLAIYAPYVSRTAITFEYDVPSVEEFARRVGHIGRRYPYIVAEAGGKAVGYAYASRFHERAAYQWSVETSIYLDMAERHHGLGRMLYTELERLLRAQGILNMNACITTLGHPDPHLPQDSVPFHEAMGFSRCAHFHKSGYKFGRWYDVVWMEKMIGEHREGW